MLMSRRTNELKSSKANAKREKPGSTKKAERTPAAVFKGWDLPFLQDENDIVNWMKREKNGDNKRKPRPNEELPEETYRHDFLRCRNVENQMEFERESLHERYRKNWQVGAMSTEIRNPPNLKKLKEEELGEPLPARKLRFPRSCKSAELPSTPKIGTLQQGGLGFPDSENPTPLLLSRSHSVIDDARLKAYGLTLPPDEKTLRLLQLAEKFTSKADNVGMKMKRSKTVVEETTDEGYDSKVSSNDNDADDDTEGSKIVQHDGSSVYTNLESILPDQAALDIGDASSTPDDEGGDTFENQEDQDIHQNLPHKLLAHSRHLIPQKDSIAKLIYSRRDLNVYERSPSRKKDTSFKYAGKEQSRLMETSLNNITPGYLNMQQLANLTSFSQNPTNQVNIDSQNQLQLLYKHYAQQSHHPPHHHHHQHHNNIQHQQQYNQIVRASQPIQQQDNLDQKQLAVRKICLQDANHSEESNTQTPIENQKLLMSHKPRSGSPCPNVQRRIKSSGSIRGDANTEETNPNSSIPNANGASTTDDRDSKTRQKDSLQEQSAKTQLLRIQDMSSKISIPSNSRIQPYIVNNGESKIPEEAESRESPQNNTPSNLKDNSPSPNPNGVGTHPISSILLKYYNKNTPYGDSKNVDNGGPSKPSHSSSNHPSSEKVTSNTYFPVADLLPAVENNLRRRKKRGLAKQQMMYRSHTMLESNIWKKDPLNSLHGGDHAPTASYHDLSNTNNTPAMVFDEATARGERQLMMQKAFGPPRFRPHHALSPLQRAKEIANRRLYGHLGSYQDSSDGIRVSSPQYMPSKLERINSASRIQTKETPRLSCDVKALVKSCPVNSRRRSSTFVCPEN